MTHKQLAQEQVAYKVMMKKKATSLLEILISMTLLAAIMVGLMNVVVSGKRLILHSRSRMTSGELGKVFVDFFPGFIRESDWDGPNNDYIPTNPLSVRGCASPCADPGNQGQAAPHNIVGITYTPSYRINTNLPAGWPVGSKMRKVRLDINWVSPRPF